MDRVCHFSSRLEESRSSWTSVVGALGMVLSSVDARCTHTEDGFGGNQGQVGETGPTRRVRKTTNGVTSTSQRATTLRCQG